MTLNPFAPAISGEPAIIIPPSGDVSGATDLAAINAGLLNGGAVQLRATPPGANQYWINGPILPTSQSRLWGAQWCSASNFDFYDEGPGFPVGSIINLTPGFTGAAAIDMYNTTATQYFGVDLAGFYVNGQNYSGTGTHGIRLQGAWGAGFIRGVCMFRFRGDGLHATFDPVQFKAPDDWLISESKFSACNGNGVFAYMPDSWFSDCESSEHAGDAWQLLQGGNTRLSGCKAENSGGAGYHLIGQLAGQYLMLNNCTSSENGQDGFLFDATGQSQLGTYLLTGCVSFGDNVSAGASFAGFRSNGSKSRIAGTGCLAIPESGGGAPAYGASEIASSYGMCFTGSWLTGSTAATHDDGSNTHALVNQSPVPF